MSKQRHNFKVFHKLCTSLGYGIIRINEARIVSLAAENAIIKTNIIGKDDLEIRLAGEKIGLSIITSSELEHYKYVTNSGYLIYATALFDTYISDVMKFLIFLNPGPYKDSLSITFDDCDNFKTVNLLKKKMIDEKVRLMSYQSFRERIREFKKSYGISFDITNEEFALLEDISSVRNAIAHDQSFIDVMYDEKSRVTAVQTACSRQPIKMSKKTFIEAFSLYMVICKKIYVAINQQVIKDIDPKMYDRFLGALTGGSNTELVSPAD